MSEPKVFAAILVPITYPAKRCCVCGDKIKGFAPEKMIQVPGFYAPGDDAFIEECCREEFETGLRHGRNEEPDAFKHGGRLIFPEIKFDA